MHVLKPRVSSCPWPGSLPWTLLTAVVFHEALRSLLSLCMYGRQQFRDQLGASSETRDEAGLTVGGTQGAALEDGGSDC
jgi:hypothetical protein